MIAPSGPVFGDSLCDQGPLRIEFFKGVLQRVQPSGANEPTYLGIPAFRTAASLASSAPTHVSHFRSCSATGTELEYHFCAFQIIRCSQAYIVLSGPQKVDRDVWNSDGC